MVECELSFSHASFDEAGSYKLVELTPDLTTLFENALKDDIDVNLTIKGHSNNDAVLCTDKKTFSMRSVSLSNTILVVTPVPDEKAVDFADGAVIIRDQLNEIIELVPVVPKLHKLSALIRERQYDESQEDEAEPEDDDSVKRFTYQDALEQIQSSEEELKNGLKERKILIVHDELRPIAPAYLTRLLELILNSLVSLSMKHDSASTERLLAELANEHEIPRAVSEQVMRWFGEIDTNSGKWTMNVNGIVKEVGLGILGDYRHEPIEKNVLLAKWKSQVGDTFESSVSLDLLAGNYIQSEVLGSDEIHLKYFPAFALPVDPAARFSELFLTHSKWKTDEITPFLSDIAVNSKERDKLLLKYCRAVTDAGVVRYSARAQYQG
ncbi:sister chromatid cohesion protein Dcc1 [Crepidotus variabilis]|uniref:Sister chromatid cohesion protein Dcc1 n=1 Tax=Crepidotus variabilis TaxID=179855 RepID=A0A9P6ES44_9AGAR|nr:sister chromatid cohesion protein Dcc1 [Crepidotus variabilis]